VFGEKVSQEVQVGLTPPPKKSMYTQRRARGVKPVVVMETPGEGAVSVVGAVVQSVHPLGRRAAGERRRVSRDFNTQRNQVKHEEKQQLKLQDIFHRNFRRLPHN